MSPHDPFIGQNIAGFRIEELLGEGGMGRVYLATQVRLKRHVAVKILPTSLVSKNKMFVKRFLREALTAAQVTHPNIVQVYDAGEFEGTFYIAMELVDGQGLDDLLKEHHIFSLGQAVGVTIQAAQGLAAAQKKNLVHRDIKPGNLMVTGEGVVKVADFGLAKNTEATHCLTEAGQVLGTPAFMSPEQGKGLPADSRSDLYSLGVTLFTMVTGTLPFEGETPVSIVLKHISDPIPDARERNSDIPDDLAEILMKVMAKEPEDRFADTEEFILALRAVLAEVGGDVALPELGFAEGGGAEPSRANRPEAITTPETMNVPPAEWRDMHVPSGAETIRTGGKGKSRLPLVAVGIAVLLLAASGIAAFVLLTKNGASGNGSGDGSKPPLTPAAAIEFTVLSPMENEFLNETRVTVTGRIESGNILEILVNGETAVFDLKERTFAAEVALTEGKKQIFVMMKGEKEAEAEKRIPVTVDLTQPVLETTPPPGPPFRLKTHAGRVRGTAIDEHLDSVTVNGNPVAVEGGSFSEDLTLAEGPNTVVVEAVDRAENRNRIELVFLVDTRSPAVEILDTPSVLESSTAEIELRGRANEELAEVRIDGRAATVDGRDFSGRVTLVAGENTVLVQATDLAGNVGEQTAQILFRKLPEGLFPGPSIGTYLWKKDNSTMVRIPAGAFVMGTDSPPEGLEDEAPAHEVELGGYFIDIFEVTKAQYGRFLAALEEGKAGDIFHPQDPDRNPTPRFWEGADGVQPDEPVIGVDWYDAWAYAKWAGKSLPTEAQWERAASWDDKERKKNRYPWGSVAPDPSRANFDKPPRSGLGHQTSKPHPRSLSPRKGSAPSGCRDMAGNVAEWCLDWFVEDFYRTPDAKKKNPVATEPVSPKKRSIRGGSWVDGPLKIRCSARRGYFPSYFLKGAYKVLGFRCVLNPEK